MGKIEQLNDKQKNIIKHGFKSTRHYVRFDLQGDPLIEDITDGNYDTILSMLRMSKTYAGGNTSQPQIQEIFKSFGLWKDGITTLEERKSMIADEEKLLQDEKAVEIEAEIKELISKRGSIDEALEKLEGMRGSIKLSIDDEIAAETKRSKKRIEEFGRKKQDDILDEVKFINNEIPDIHIRTTVNQVKILAKLRAMDVEERELFTIAKIQGVLSSIGVYYKKRDTKPVLVKLMENALKVD